MAEAASISYGNEFSSEPRKSLPSKHIPDSSKVVETPGGFTYPGSEDDRCPMHQDGGKSSSVLSRPMLLTPRSPSRRWIVTFRLHIGTRLVDAHDERRTTPPDLRLG